MGLKNRCTFVSINYIKFYAYGHPNIKATHKSTLEITKENYLTSRGTCIIGIGSNISCLDLPNYIKERIKTRNSRIILSIRVDELREYIFGYGSDKLTLKSGISMVFRKSDYMDERTVMIKANKSASDINRRIISRLRNKGKPAEFILIVY